MITFVDPARILVQVVESNFDINVKIEYVSGMNNLCDKILFRKKYGMTFFPDNGSDPIIQLDCNLSVKDAVEVLAHELAHVIAGIDKNHGKEWEDIFSEIHELYTTEFNREIKNTYGENQ